MFLESQFKFPSLFPHFLNTRTRTKAFKPNSNTKKNSRNHVPIHASYRQSASRVVFFLRVLSLSDGIWLNRENIKRIRDDIIVRRKSIVVSKDNTNYGRIGSSAKRARRDPRPLETAVEIAPRVSARVDFARFDRVSFRKRTRRRLRARVSMMCDTAANCTVSISSP